MATPLPVHRIFVGKFLIQLLYLVNLIGIVGHMDHKGLHPTPPSRLLRQRQRNPPSRATGGPAEEAAEVTRSPPPNHIFPAVSGFLFPFFFLSFA